MVGLGSLVVVDDVGPSRGGSTMAMAAAPSRGGGEEGDAAGNLGFHRSSMAVGGWAAAISFV